MKIERDREADLLYIELREGDVADTLDLAEGVHLDADAEGRVLGVEFLSFDAFEHYLERHGGQVELPERVAVRGDAGGAVDHTSEYGAGGAVAQTSEDAARAAEQVAEDVVGGAGQLAEDEWPGQRTGGRTDRVG